MRTKKNYDFIIDIRISDEMITELGIFTLLWAQFELVYCENNCSADKLRKIFCSINISNELIKSGKDIIDKLLKYIKKDKTSITNTDIEERLYSEKHKKIDNEVEVVLKRNTNNKDLLTGVLFIIRRLRDNMFHGLKDCYTINQQLPLFQSVNKLLNIMVTPLFE